MLNAKLEAIKAAAEQYAQAHNHEFVVTEHLLFALCDDEDVLEILTALQVDVARLKQDLMIYLGTFVPTGEIAPSYSKNAERSIRRAIFHVQSSARANDKVAPRDLLVALMSETDTYSVKLLNDFGVTRLRLLRYISHHDKPKQAETESAGSDEQKAAPPKKDPLASYTINLNERAKQGKTDPLIGRLHEIERCAQILIRRRKNNPLLVGDPGVGKTAIAEGLAWLIVNKQVPKALESAVIYSLDMGVLVAGTKFRGDFEARMKELLIALKNTPNAILFIDEIHTVIGAGSSMNSSMDMSNLIKPALANGELRCIGSTTFSEYRQIFEKDHALSRRFQKIDVVEPTIAEAIDILNGLKSTYEAFHHVHYTDEAIVAAVELSARHIHDRFLPDKAIDVIDEVGALQNLHHPVQDDDSADKQDDADKQNNPDGQGGADGQNDSDRPKVRIDAAMIEQTVAKIARIAPNAVTADDKTTLRTLKEDLNQVIFGQSAAIDKLSDAIVMSKAGLKDIQKPIGSFLFAGPTGVGKTEVCKQLAFKLGIALIRFDMSEYMESHTASRLIGAPPGYVGFDNGGLLTEKVHQTPHCVLLLDEIEKAHPDVFNLLLQVMDNGTLTDNNGRQVSFREVILIMTTNAGAAMMSRASMGFTEQQHHLDSSEEIKRLFTPEFRNRLDAIVQFAPLDESVIVSVVDKLLTELQSVLDEKDVVLDVDDEVRDYLAKKGYDKLMGARPMARLINDEIKKPLAQMILFDEAQGVVKVRLKDGVLELESAQGV